MLIPITVLKYFAQIERIDPLYVQARRAGDVDSLTTAVRSILEGRHRAGARYSVDNLAAILDAAKNIATVLTVVLVLVSAHRADHFRNRHHEHHAGDGDGADARNRTCEWR